MVQGLTTDQAIEVLTEMMLTDRGRVHGILTVINPRQAAQYLTEIPGAGPFLVIMWEDDPARATSILTQLIPSDAAPLLAQMPTAQAAGLLSDYLAAGFERQYQSEIQQGESSAEADSAANVWLATATKAFREALTLLPATPQLNEQSVVTNLDGIAFGGGTVHTSLNNVLHISQGAGDAGYDVDVVQFLQYATSRPLDAAGRLNIPSIGSASVEEVARVLGVEPSAITAIWTEGQNLIHAVSAITPYSTIADTNGRQIGVALLLHNLGRPLPPALSFAAMEPAQAAPLLADMPPEIAAFIFNDLDPAVDVAPIFYVMDNTAAALIKPLMDQAKLALITEAP